MKPNQDVFSLKLISASHSIGQNVYHLEWCPKYRYNMFRGQEHKNLFEQILKTIAFWHNITLIEIAIMPDHVHLVVSLPPTMSVSKALNLLKGASSRELFQQKPDFRKRYHRGHFWSPGKFYRTTGDADLPTVINYVKEQRLVQTTLNVISPSGQ
jgi:putative transposase